MLFAKLSTLALALPLVSAFSINVIVGGTTGQTATITWSASTTDPAYFSIELVNPVFNNEFAIANSVQTSLGTLTITLPQVPPGDGYSLEAIAINDVSDIYAQSGPFSIGAATTTSGTAASTSSTPATTGTGTTSPATVSAPSVTATTPVSSVTPGSTSGTSTAASSTPSTFSSGAATVKIGGIAPAAALVLSAVAGAVMVF